MIEIIAPYFRDLYDRTGLNFIVFYDDYEYSRLISGISTSLQLIFWCLIVSIGVGVVGAWAQRSHYRPLRWLLEAYIQFFRNTPVMVQLLFFYFGLGNIMPEVDAGGYYQPLISSFGWAIISIGMFGGAFNVEIFRAGLEAVPSSTKEAAESLGFTAWQTYLQITLPLAFRISLPALTNNLVSLAKTTSFAYVISVPELTYTLNQIWSDNVNVPEMMLLLFLFYIIVITLFAGALHWLEHRLALPGYGQ